MPVQSEFHAYGIEIPCLSDYHFISMESGADVGGGISVCFPMLYKRLSALLSGAVLIVNFSFKRYPIRNEPSRSKKKDSLPAGRLSVCRRGGLSDGLHH